MFLCASTGGRPANEAQAIFVYTLRETFKALFSKLFSRKPEPGERVRICVECGMPVAEHKDWCSIYRTQQEMKAKKSSA